MACFYWLCRRKCEVWDPDLNKPCWISSNNKLCVSNRLSWHELPFFFSKVFLILGFYFPSLCSDYFVIPILGNDAATPFWGTQKQGIHCDSFLLLQVCFFKGLSKFDLHKCIVEENILFVESEKYWYYNKKLIVKNHENKALLLSFWTNSLHLNKGQLANIYGMG